MVVEKAVTFVLDGTYILRIFKDRGKRIFAKFLLWFQDAENNAVRQNRLVEHLKSESESMRTEVENRGNVIKNLTDKVCISLWKSAQRLILLYIHMPDRYCTSEGTERDKMCMLSLRFQNCFIIIWLSYQKKNKCLYKVRYLWHLYVSQEACCNFHAKTI